MIVNIEVIKRFDIWKKEKEVILYDGRMPYPIYRISAYVKNYSFDEIFEMFLQETGIGNKYQEQN